jgi:hypothetical protein
MWSLVDYFHAAGGQNSVVFGERKVHPAKPLPPKLTFLCSGPSMMEALSELRDTGPSIGKTGSRL